MRPIVQLFALLALSLAATASSQPRLILPLPPQPAPMAEIDVTTADVAAGDAEVHAVFVHDHPGDWSKRPLVEPAPGLPPIVSLRVQITTRTRPVVLVVGAYNPIYWDIEIEPGVQLRKVIVQGHYRQFVSPLPAGVRAVTYKTNLPVGVQALHGTSEPRALYDLFENVRRLTGKRPATLQPESKDGTFLVDGSRTAEQPDVSQLVASPSAVSFASTPNCCTPEKTYATNKTNRAYVRGRYYAEAHFHPAPGHVHPQETTNLGVMSLGASPAGRLLAPATHLNGHGFPVLDARSRAAVKAGSVVGLAVDLDAGRLYFHVDGQWLGGEPQSSKGIALPRGAEYVLATSVHPWSERQMDAWGFNFGASKFRHPPPAGFVAYVGGENPISAFPLRTDHAAIHRSVQQGNAVRAAAAGAARAQAEQRPPPCGPGADFEVHAVGVYQAKDQPQRGFQAPSASGNVRVDVVRPGARVCLLLMAYEPVEWRVGVAPGTKLAQVVAMGTYPHTVKGLDDPGLVTLWPGPSGSDPRTFLYRGEPGREQYFAERTRALAGKTASTFQGGYYGESFIVDGTTTGVLRTDEPKTHVIRCGQTTIVCTPEDTVMCGGRRVPCR